MGHQARRTDSNHDEENTMAEPANISATGICGYVTIAHRKGVVANAEVQLFSESTTRTKGRARRPTGEPVQRTRTDTAGRYQFTASPETTWSFAKRSSRS